MNITSEEYAKNVQNLYELNMAKTLIQQVIEQGRPIHEGILISRATFEAAIKFVEDYISGS